MPRDRNPDVLPGDCSLPPGCRCADLDRGVSRLDDLSSTELWELLDDDAHSDLYRDFFHRRWAELAATIDDHELSNNRAHNSASLGDSICGEWIAWRNTTLQQKAMSGQIRLPSTKGD